MLIDLLTGTIEPTSNIGQFVLRNGGIEYDLIDTLDELIATSVYTLRDRLVEAQNQIQVLRVEVNKLREELKVELPQRTLLNEKTR